MFGKILSLTVNICAYEFRVYSFLYVIKYIIVNDYLCHLCGVILTLKSNGCDINIPRQSDIDKIVKNIETHVMHSLELSIQAQDLVKVYQHSTHFRDIYQYLIDGKFPSSAKAQNCIRAEALNYIVINHFLFRIDM